MSNSFNLTFSVGSQSFNVGLSQADHPDVIIAGRGYRLTGDEAISSLVMERLENLPSKNFESLESFKAALLKMSDGQQKIHQLAIDQLSDSSASAANHAISGETIVKGPEGRLIDDRLKKEVLEKGFSGSVRLVKKGKVILQKSYGPANEQLENTPRTTFRIASLSKAMIGVAIMRLHDEQKLDINSKVPRKFFQSKITQIEEEIKKLELEPDAESKKRIGELNEQLRRLESITIGQLLTHASGFTDNSELGGFKGAYEAFGEEIPGRGTYVLESHSPQELWSTLIENVMLDNPGVKREYSNMGYLLLGLIIEDVTGHSLKETLSQMFSELQMEDSRFPIAKSEDTPQARSYDAVRQKNHELKREAVEKGPDDCTARWAGGNIISSVVDLAKFEQGLCKSKENGGILSSNALNLMREKGYGWDRCGKDLEEAILGKNNPAVTGNRGWVLKDGNMDGAHSMLISFPDIESSIIMIGNTNTLGEGQGDLGMLSFELARMLNLE